VKDGGFDLNTMTTTLKSTMNYEILGVEKSFLEGLALDMPFLNNVNIQFLRRKLFKGLGCVFIKST
jgi:hypothetical protein